MKNKISRFLTWGSLAVHLISLPALPVLGSMNFESETLLLAITFLLCCGWLPISSLSLSWLVWVGRYWTSKVAFWAGFQILFVFLIISGLSEIPFVSFIALFYFLALIPVILIVNLLHAHFYHRALWFLSWGSIGLVWSIVLSWRIQGDLFDILLANLGEKMNHASILTVGMMGLTGAMILTGMIIFTVESLRICSLEISSSQ